MNVPSNPCHNFFGGSILIFSEDKQKYEKKVGISLYKDVDV